MIEEIIKRNEGKTLEFKESAFFLEPIAKTAIAFANTAGGIILIGIKDGKKELIGVENPLEEEGRIANYLSQTIFPLLIPDIQIITYHKREFIVIRVPHCVGPFFLKASGPGQGTYVRYGSTNRVADSVTVQGLKLLALNKRFDELPYIEAEQNDIDWEVAESLFLAAGKTLDRIKAENLGLIVKKNDTVYPTNGGLLLFAHDRKKYFHDARIRCARFLGVDREKILDESEIIQPLPLSIEPVISFIERNTQMGVEIGRIAHIRVPQYPPISIREAVINALIHCDYAVHGVTITIAIFDDRIELTNPGGLPYGLTLSQALAGSSQLRNKVITVVFKELRLIEQWGSGMQKIIKGCTEAGLARPLFEEINNTFRVTLYGLRSEPLILKKWQEELIQYLKSNQRITRLQAAELLGVTPRTAYARLKSLADLGLIQRISSSEKDPTAFYILDFESSNDQK